MCFQGITHTVRGQIASQEFDALLVQADVTQSWILLLQHGVQHILHGVGTLGELIKHDDDGLAGMHTESSVRVVASCLALVVNHGHCDVAQVHIGYVDIRMGVAQTRCNCFQQTGLANTGLALQQEHNLGVAANQVRSLLEGNCFTKRYFSHFLTSF